MEKFELTLQSQPAIDAYIQEGHLMAYKKELLAEMSAAMKTGNAELAAWFAGFGDSFRQILMNVHDYRKGLEFGFTEIAFNQYGWLSAPKFLDYEEIRLEQSSIRIGRGPNGIWAYALSRSYGCAGASGPLCVFCRPFANREIALETALNELKADMSKYLGHSDTTNYKQDILTKTLKAIAAYQVDRIQLSLF